MDWAKMFGNIEVDPEMPEGQIDIVTHQGRRVLMTNIAVPSRDPFAETKPDPPVTPALVTPAMVTLHHLANSLPLCCDLCREQIGWTWEFAAPTGMVYCSSCKDAPPSRLTRAASSERKEFQ